MTKAPYDQPTSTGPVEAQLVDDRRHVVGPELAVGVVLGLERRLGHAVAAEVVGDEPELVGEGALVLLVPAEMVLRPAVDEQDRRPVRHCPTRARAAAGRRRPAPCEPSSARAASRRLVRPLSSSRLLAVVVIDAIVAVEEPERIGRRALSFAAGLRIFGRRRRRRTPRRLRDTGGMEARASDVFVGRARELGELERALDAAQAGSGATVLVAGEAGIGKTPARVRARAARPRRRLRGPARALDRSRRHGAAVPAVRRGAASARRASAGRRPTAGSQLRVFEETLALLTDRAAAAPVLLVLEDLHWADTSTLDLVVFLAHNLDDRRVLLLATYRADELSSAERMRRLADGVRRSGSALVLELGPLERDELTALLAARADAPLPAARDGRDRRPLRGQPLLRRGAPRRRRRRAASSRAACATCCCSASAELDRRDAEPAAAGRGRRTRRRLPAAPRRRRRSRSATCASRCAGRSSTASSSPTRRRGSFRFRHALLAEAIYATILPGEREELHARLADELARSGAASPAELAPHWAAAGRSAEALAASVEAAREAEAVFGLAEAHAHLERALALWPAVPDAAELAGLDLAELCAWAAELASQIGAAPRAVELARRAIELVGDERPAPCGAPPRAPRRVPRTRPAATTPASPRSSARSSSCRRSRPRRSARTRWRHSPAALMVAWRHAESLPICRAGARARSGRRRTRGGGPSAHRARRRPRLPRPRRGGGRRIFARPCSSPRRSAIASAWTERTSISPTC